MVKQEHVRSPSVPPHWSARPDPSCFLINTQGVRLVVSSLSCAEYCHSVREGDKERFDNVVSEPVLVMLHVVARLLQEQKFALLVQSLQAQPVFCVERQGLQVGSFVILQNYTIIFTLTIPCHK